MNLDELRELIDQIDAQLLDLFVKRMDIVAGIALYKQAGGLPILDRKREKEKLQMLQDKARPDLQLYTERLFETLFAFSRAHQTEVLGGDQS